MDLLGIWAVFRGVCPGVGDIAEAPLLVRALTRPPSLPPPGLLMSFLVDGLTYTAASSSVRT